MADFPGKFNIRMMADWSRTGRFEITFYQNNKETEGAGINVFGKNKERGTYEDMASKVKSLMQ
jgi:hypothetical protein